MNNQIQDKEDMQTCGCARAHTHTQRQGANFGFQLNLYYVARDFYVAAGTYSAAHMLTM